MEAEALKRKERLAAMRAAMDADSTGDSTADDSTADEGAVEGSRKRPRSGEAESAGEPDGSHSDGGRNATNGEHPKLRFRNYNPVREELKTYVQPKPELPTVEDEVKKLERPAEDLSKAHTVDLLNLAPKKPNWDLKRDLERRLVKVEKQTKRAIAELIRDRVLKERDVSQLATGGDVQRDLDAGEESD